MSAAAGNRMYYCLTREWASAWSKWQYETRFGATWKLWVPYFLPFVVFRRLWLFPHFSAVVVVFIVGQQHINRAHKLIGSGQCYLFTLANIVATEWHNNNFFLFCFCPMQMRDWLSWHVLCISYASRLCDRGRKDPAWWLLFFRGF